MDWVYQVACNRIARRARDIKVLASGDPEKVLRRGRNKLPMLKESCAWEDWVYNLIRPVIKELMMNVVVPKRDNTK
ncbi:hypothetical protein [Methanothrix sp.]|uniref:hypothetical protein n=1 Tax=Methanothrix sp. TaxID=90426 RepID=UPI003296BA73